LHAGTGILAAFILLRVEMQKVLGSSGVMGCPSPVVMGIHSHQQPTDTRELQKLSTYGKKDPENIYLKCFL